MFKTESRYFNDAVYCLSGRLKEILNKLPTEIKSKADEIRLRADLPLSLTVEGKSIFVSYNGRATTKREEGLFIASKDDINECFKSLCGGSVYAHESELKNGFIKCKNGCRAGICGTVTANGNMREITSINIRIAREILGAADSIVNAKLQGGLLIAGPPASGKTTVLRDLIRQMSNNMRRVAVIDTRGEISGAFHNDLGANTDVIITPDKAKGIEMALRTMFPDIIAFDEIGSEKELDSVRQSFLSGVEIITTAHIGDISELTERLVTKSVILSGAVSNIVLLPKNHNGKINIISVRELLRGIAV